MMILIASPVTGLAAGGGRVVGPGRPAGARDAGRVLPPRPRRALGCALMI